MDSDQFCRDEFDSDWVIEREDSINKYRALGFIQATGQGSTADLDWLEDVIDDLKLLFESETFKIRNPEPDGIVPGSLAAMPPIRTAAYPFHGAENENENENNEHRNRAVVPYKHHIS